MEKEQNLIRVGISIGDINGIGPEVVIKALSDNRILQSCTPIVYASSKTLSYHKKTLRNVDFPFQSIKTSSEAIPNKINIINAWNEEVRIEFGKPTETSGKYAFLSLEKATEDLASNGIDVLVTAPISKEAIQSAGFQFPGHTEYLAHLSGEPDALMMMVAGNLRVAIVTSHIALKDVSSSMSIEKIRLKIQALNNSLKKDFGIIKPKIAVFGLNPHAGENGKMGDEEIQFINPAIKLAQDEDNILAYGPYPADGFFGSSQLGQFDAILAMYHDQGLTAFKALSFDEGVNFTAGLPIVRTSPDHGTAYDIAGKNKASESSLRQAIYLAIDVYKSRKFIKEINQNPLPFSEPKENRRNHSDRDE